jgi:hypothetical protein
MIYRQKLYAFLLFILITFGVSACNFTGKELSKYEGKIIHQTPANRGIQDGLFIVRGGGKLYIGNMAWVHENGFKEKDFILITPEEFNEIPDGEGPLR